MKYSVELMASKLQDYFLLEMQEDLIHHAICAVCHKYDCKGHRLEKHRQLLAIQKKKLSIVRDINENRKSN